MLESVAEALHLPTEEVSLGLGPRGFARRFLEDKAWALDKEGKWLPFSTILALLIYGVLKQVEKERGDNHYWFELVVKEKKALRDKSDLEIHDLKLSLREANAKIEAEHRLKEEAIRVSYVTPQIWREKCPKVELSTLSAEHWRDRFFALKNESLGWLKMKAQMNSLLDTYVGYINLLQPATTLYQAKYLCNLFLAVKLTSHFYNTRAKQKIAMERIEQNQTAMQEEMAQANPGSNINVNTTNPIMGNGVPIVTQPHVEGMPTNLNASHTYHVPIHGGSQAGTEDHNGDFFMPRNESVYEPFGPPQTKLERKLKMMDERVQAIKADEVSTLEIPYYLVRIPVENAPVTPLVITVPTHFPYESTKVVPWNYNSTAYLHGQRLEERSSKTQKTLLIHEPSEVSKHVGTSKFVEVQKLVVFQKPMEAQELVVNITGASGMSQSGRIFIAPPPPPKKENLGANSKNRGKQPADLE
ncbi:hypothetical protein KIW84_023118 [Lathyrus oleraceus]|uniref:DUF7745 domain-containing protein n=1 Tax=Pisum sativum TaxID=3888 RepID=A0A9D4YDC5_PEA|nr:hypothetical protein KIW84_023118 [Pisum sativum]